VTPESGKSKSKKTALLPPVCYCQGFSKPKHAQNLPKFTPGGLELENDARFAIDTLKKQRNGIRRDTAKLQVIDDRVKDLRTYTTAFRKILKTEREEILLQYERYSQYNHKVVVEDEERPGNTPLFLKMCIPGLSDARPSPEPEDLLLLRPLNLLSLPLDWTRPRMQWSHPIHYVEIVSHVVQVTRNPKGDELLATWFDRRYAPIIKVANAEEKYNLRIVPNNKTFLHSLVALDWCNTIPPKIMMPLLFPTEAPDFMSVQKEFPELNSKQASFARVILGRTQQPSMDLVRSPMILTGPAGTGKTRTLFHTILAVLESSSSNKILVCTPSHTAANVITRRLGTAVAKNALFRLLDSDRPVATIPLSILPYCKQDMQTGKFVLPSEGELMRYRVIVVTCTDAALLYNMGLTNQQLRQRRKCFTSFCRKGCEDLNMNAKIEGTDQPHFTHFFMDEAAQATEPESLIPLSVVVDPEPGSVKVEIALCGDPRQLSPATYSSEAAAAGLEQSWMERLLRRPFMCLGGGEQHMLGPELINMDDWLRFSLERDGQEQLSIFLTLNYRGHESMLMVPSALFYSDRLQRAGYEDESHADGLKWCQRLRCVEQMYEPVMQTKTDGFQPDELAQKKEYDWPILFYGVIGLDKTVSVNNAFSINSWSNAEEAEAIVDIIAKLISEGVQSNDIGVMSPFRGQVVLIRHLLRARYLGAVDVGTIEDYQAVERNVIILSLTRSSTDFVPNDKLRRVGVFGQPKRSNVALTRPENMLIVVGNPKVMVEDFVWRQFLWFCLRNGLWYGESGGIESIFEWANRKDVIVWSENKGALAVMKEDDDNEVILVSSLESFHRKNKANFVEE
jgi:hypothetical protein